MGFLRRSLRSALPGRALGLGFVASVLLWGFTPHPVGPIKPATSAPARASPASGKGDAGVRPYARPAHVLRAANTTGCKVDPSDSLVAYAKKCKDAIGVELPAFNCDSGTLVPVTNVTGNYPNQDCDRPNVLNAMCDPGSTFQVLTQSQDAITVALCRKKGNGVGFYGDVAVIQYNQVNGATCFFQALGQLPAKVTAPSEGDGSGKFPWMSPSSTASIQCVRCHDNGPFVRSPYLAQLSNEPKNRLPGTNPGPGPWDKRYSWNTTNPYSFVGSDFQSWKAYKLIMSGTGSGCMNCHRLGISSSGGSFNTSSGTALNFGPKATNRLSHQNFLSFNSPIWMMPGQTFYDAETENEAKAVAACAGAIMSGQLSPPGCAYTKFAQGNTCLGTPAKAQVRAEETLLSKNPPLRAPVAQPLVSRYVLDLSESENQGVAAGNFLNFAFTLNLHQPTTKISVPFGDQRLSNLVATFDYADCTKGQELLLEAPLGDLAAGDPGWVDSVEVELIPLPQKDIDWSGGVCYGYREPGGKWRWTLTSVPLTYDAATDRVRARIRVQRGPIDAFKLVFDHTVPRQSVSRVSITTRPITATPEP